MRNISTYILFILFAFVSCQTQSQLLKTEENTSFSLQDSIISFGKNYMRTPYLYGGTSPRGFDCSGFTSHVYRNFGYKLDRSSRDQAKQFPKVKKADLRTGDLVFFKGRNIKGAVGHVGIVSEVKPNGEFDFLHASVQYGVTVSSSSQPYYAARFVGGGRVVADNKYEVNTLSRDSSIKSNGFEDIHPSSLQPQAVNNNAVYHIVKRGETLSLISKKYDVPISTIQYLNGLTSKRIKNGQRLLIVEAAQVSQMTVAEIANDQLPAKDTEYVVKKGDTLHAISRRFNCSIADLKKWNSDLQESIKIGQVILINQ